MECSRTLSVEIPDPPILSQNSRIPLTVSIVNALFCQVHPRKMECNALLSCLKLLSQPYSTLAIIKLEKLLRQKCGYSSVLCVCKFTKISDRLYLFIAFSGLQIMAYISVASVNSVKKCKVSINKVPIWQQCLVDLQSFSFGNSVPS